MAKTYIFSNKTKGILEGKGKSRLSCARCGKSFHIGEVIIAKPQRNHTRLYHSYCYNSMFIDLEKRGD